jgi:hypothetical protein
LGYEPNELPLLYPAICVITAGAVKGNFNLNKELVLTGAKIQLILNSANKK